jgi:hypothetical protein
MVATCVANVDQLGHREAKFVRSMARWVGEPTEKQRAWMGVHLLQAPGSGAMTDILKLLKGVRKSGADWTARCPAHDDQRNSLSVRRGEGKWLLCCHASCKIEDVTAALGLMVADLFDDEAGGMGAFHPSGNRATGYARRPDA